MVNTKIKSRGLKYWSRGSKDENVRPPFLVCVTYLITPRAGKCVMKLALSQIQLNLHSLQTGKGIYEFSCLSSEFPFCILLLPTSLVIAPIWVIKHPQSTIYVILFRKLTACHLGSTQVPLTFLLKIQWF